MDPTKNLPLANMATLEKAMELGTLSGMHLAFGTVANKCSAADADILKQIRDSGYYKQFNMTWSVYCRNKLNVSRTYADRLIKCREEFGEDYFRIAQVVPMSGETYRLIEGSVSKDGIEIDGEIVAIKKENQKQIAAAVETVRANRKPADKKSGIAAASRRMKAFIAELNAVEVQPSEQLEFINLVSEAAQYFTLKEQALRANYRLM
jgi:maltooligosyltrehalose synthase